MKIEERGLIYDAAQAPDARRIAFFTGLCPLRSGTILSGFQVGPGKHAPTATIQIQRSRDGGRTWTPVPFEFETTVDGAPGSLSAAELVEPEPGRLLLFSTWFDRSDPERPLFNPETEGILRSKQLTAVSTDEGGTWSPWREIPTPGLTGCASTGPVSLWSDGVLAYAFESFKEFDDPTPAKLAAWLIVSRDGGRTFGLPSLVARDPANQVYYWDQRHCPTANPGGFVALFWTHDRLGRCDRNVHLLRSSLDKCGEADPPRETSIPGQIAAPLILDDGRLLAFVVDRGRPGTLTLWQSADGGGSWPRADALTVHVHDERALVTQGKENIDFSQYWEDMGKWSFGHPAIRRLDDGRVLLAYYAGSPDRMSIHWARVAV